MKELHAAIPDPDVLLALEPEELGAQILLLLRERERTFSLAGIVDDLQKMNDRNNTGYPRARMHEIERALTEAFCWLESQVLIVPPDQENGRNGYRTLSRRGGSLKTEEDLRQFRMTRQLNRDLLHPAIAEKVWLGFMRGDFAEAVFTAMRTVEIAVREAAGLPEGDHGVPMIRRAFHKDNGPLRDREQEEAEREALTHLFAGAVGSYKNPHSHRNVPMEDAGEAIEIVTLASHLLRIVDARRPAQQERQTDEA